MKIPVRRDWRQILFLVRMKKQDIPFDLYMVLNNLIVLKKYSHSVVFEIKKEYLSNCFCSQNAPDRLPDEPAK
jgi:hypothetical protein